jgi:molecular chaperone GrpE
MSHNGSAMNNESQQDVGGDDLAADVHAARREDSAENASDEIQRLADDLAKANDRALRAQAELENFRRRMRREMEDERRYAALPLITDLLGVVDNLERALAASESNQAAEGLRQGVEMVQSQFVAVLEKHHCRRLGSVGDPFDPNLHQAIAQEPSDQFSPGTVTRVIQVGYQIHDRVVRPAHVMVSSGAPPQENPSSQSKAG